MFTELSVDDVLINEQLNLRPVHSTCADTEINSLRNLAQTFLTDPSELMDATVATVCELCNADSAGITVIDMLPDGSERLRWVATAGRIQEAGLHMLPRGHSPCGTVLDRKAPQLFSHPRRFFTYIDESWHLVEALLVPWQVGSTIRGTLWAMIQNDSNKFDREDLRMLQTLVVFAGVAVARDEMEHKRRIEDNIASGARVANELAHAMNNPLQALTNSLYLADTECPEHLQNAKQELHRLSNLVGEILKLNAARPVASISIQASSISALG